MRQNKGILRLAALILGLVITAGVCVPAVSAAWGRVELPEEEENTAEMTAAFDRLLYAAGDTVTVSFILQGPDFDAAGFCVAFDPEELTYRGCEAGEGFTLPVLRGGDGSLEAVVQSETVYGGGTGVTVARVTFTAVTGGSKTLQFVPGSAAYLGEKTCVAYNGYQEWEVTPRVAEDAAADAELRQAKIDAVNTLTTDLQEKLQTGVTVAQQELLARCLQQGKVRIHNAQTVTDVIAARDEALKCAEQILQDGTVDYPRLLSLTNGARETDPLEEDLYPEFSPETTAYFLLENRPLEGIPHDFRGSVAAKVSVTFNDAPVSVASDGSFAFSVPFRNLENISTLVLTDDETGLSTTYLFFSCGYGVKGGPTGITVYDENGKQDSKLIGAASGSGPVLYLSTSTGRVRIGFKGAAAANQVFRAELVDSNGRVLQTFTTASDDNPVTQEFLSDVVTLQSGQNWLLLRYYGVDKSKWQDGKPASTPAYQTKAIVIRYTDPEEAEKDPTLTDTKLDGIHIWLEGSQDTERMVSFDPEQRKYRVELDARDFDTALNTQAVHMTVDKRSGQSIYVYGGNGAAQARKLLRDGTYHIADYLDTEVPQADQFQVTITVTAKDGQHKESYTLTIVKKGMSAMILPAVYRDREVIITPNSPYRTWNLVFASMGLTDGSGNKLSVSEAMKSGLLTMEIEDPSVIGWDGAVSNGSFVIELRKQGETALKLIYDDGNGIHLKETAYLAINYSAEVLNTTLESARKVLSDTSRKYDAAALRKLKQVIKNEEQTYETYKTAPRRNLTQPQIGDINRGVNALLDAMRELLYAEVAEEIIAFTPLAPEVTYQEVPNDTPQRLLNLPDTLQVTLADGTVTELTGVKWTSSPAYKTKQEEAKKYRFTPVLPAGYKPARGVELPQIWVQRAEIPFAFDVRRWKLPEGCTGGRLLVPLGTANAEDIMKLSMQAHVRDDYYRDAPTKWEDVDGFNGNQVGQYIFRAKLIENVLDPETNTQFVWSDSVPESRRTMDMVVYVFDLTMNQETLALPAGSESDALSVVQGEYPVNALTASLYANHLSASEEERQIATVKERLEWSSSDPTVVAVDAASGHLTAVRQGEATVTARLAGTNLSASCRVSVSQITIKPSGLNLTIGTSGQLTIAEKLAKGATVTWSSDKESVATVDKDGLVTAHDAGQCEITATVRIDGVELSATAVVYVTSGGGSGGESSGTTPSGGGESDAKPSNGTGTLQGQDLSGGEYRDLLTDPEQAGAQPDQSASAAQKGLKSTTDAPQTPGTSGETGTGTGGHRIFAVDGETGDVPLREVLLIAGVSILLVLCGVWRGRKVLGGRHRAEKTVKKALVLLLSVGCLLSGLPAAAYAAPTENETPAGHIVLSIEKLTLGQGFILEPQQVPYYKNENLAQVLDRVLTEQGLEYHYTGKLTDGFYLAELEDRDRPGIAGTMPAYITEMWSALKANNPTTRSIGDTDTQDPDFLGEFDYFTQSGWMYSVNHVFLPVGAADCKAADGMVVRWQFSLIGYGGDLGSGGTTAAGSRSFMDRTELYTVLAAVRADADLMADSKVRPVYDRLLAQCCDITAEESSVKEDMETLKKALGGNQITELSLPDGENGLRTCAYGTAKEAMLRDLPTYLRARIDGTDKLITGITWAMDAEPDAPGTYSLRPVLPEKYNRYTLLAALPLMQITVQPPSGDMNGDTVLDLQDVSLLASAAGRKDRPTCDLDGNGVVTWNDFRLLAASVGTDALLTGTETGATGMTVEFEKETYRVGETATAIIRASGATFDTFALTLTYDTRQLSLSAASAVEPLLRTGYVTAEGSLRLGGASLEGAVTDGQVATVTFTVQEDCAPAAQVQRAALLCGGETASWTAKQRMVLRGAAVSLLPGDLDENGTVDLDDAIRLIEYCNGRANLSPYELQVADVNGDGTVNLQDAALLAQYCNGLIDALPVHRGQ